MEVKSKGVADFVSGDEETPGLRRRLWRGTSWRTAGPFPSGPLRGAWWWTRGFLQTLFPSPMPLWGRDSESVGTGGHLQPVQRPPGRPRAPESGAAAWEPWAAPWRLRQEVLGITLKPLQTLPCLSDPSRPLAQVKAVKTGLGAKLRGRRLDAWWGGVELGGAPFLAEYFPWSHFPLPSPSTPHPLVC